MADWPIMCGTVVKYGHVSSETNGRRIVFSARAFRASLRAMRYPVYSTWRHDASMWFATTKDRTLKLIEDRYGVRFVIYPPATAASRKVYDKINETGASGMSPAYVVTKSRWQRIPRAGLVQVIEQAAFTEVSIVDRPLWRRTTFEVQWGATAHPSAAHVSLVERLLEMKRAMHLPERLSQAEYLNLGKTAAKLMRWRRLLRRGAVLAK